MIDLVEAPSMFLVFSDTEIRPPLVLELHVFCHTPFLYYKNTHFFIRKIL